MSLGLRCPGCRERMSVPESAVGRRVQCPRCRHVFRYSGQRELTLGRVKPKPAGLAKAMPRFDPKVPDTVPLDEMELLLSEAKESVHDVVPIEEVVEVTPEEAAVLFEPTPGEPEAVVAEHEVESLLADPDIVDFVDVAEEVSPAAPMPSAPIAPPTPAKSREIDAIVREKVDVAPPPKASEIPNIDIETMLDEEIAASPLIGASMGGHTGVESAAKADESEPILELGGPMPNFDPDELSRYFQQSAPVVHAPPQLSLNDISPPPPLDSVQLPAMVEETAEASPVRAEFAEAEAPIRAEIAPRFADDDVDLARLFESEVEPIDADIVNAELAEPIVDDWPGVSNTKTKARKK